MLEGLDADPNMRSALTADQEKQDQGIIILNAQSVMQMANQVGGVEKQDQGITILNARSVMQVANQVGGGGGEDPRLQGQAAWRDHPTSATAMCYCHVCYCPPPHTWHCHLV